MEDTIYFERCIDFMARMIEKYGNELLLPDADEGKTKLTTTNKTA